MTPLFQKNNTPGSNLLFFRANKLQKEMRRFRIVKNLTLIVVLGTEIAKFVTVIANLWGCWAGEGRLPYQSKERRAAGATLLDSEFEQGRFS